PIVISRAKNVSRLAVPDECPLRAKSGHRGALGLVPQRFISADLWTPTGSMSTLGHVWTAPWQELSDVAAAFGRVRSRVRPVCAADLAAGPNALRGSGPNRKHAL